MTAPWLVATTDGAPTPLAASLRKVEAPAAGGTPFRDLRPAGAAPAGSDAAARELAQVKAELGALRAKAEAEGKAAGQASAAKAAASLQQAAAALDATRAELVGADAATLVDLALEIASALLGRTLAADRAALEATVAGALAAVDAPAPRLRMHPADHASVATMAPTNVKLEADASLAPGEIRVETERAVVDGTVAARLAALRDPLIAALEEEAAHAE